MAWAAVTSQHAHNTLNGTATSFTVTLPGNATVGNRVVMEVGASVLSATPTVSVSGLGGTWSKDSSTTGANGSFNEEGALWSVVVGSASTTITITITGGTAANTFAGAAAQEYSGLASAGGASDIDVANSSTGTSGTPSTTTAATSAANELVVGGYNDDGANSAKTVGSGFTARDNATPNSVSQNLIEDKDSGASGAAQTANTGNTTGQRWFMSGVVYKLASGGGGATVEAPLLMMMGIGG